MKKISGVLLALVLLWMGCVGAIAEASITIISAEDKEQSEDIKEPAQDDSAQEEEAPLDDELATDESAEEEFWDEGDFGDEDASQDVQIIDENAPDAPAVRWNYPVPLSMLQSSVIRLVNRDHLLEEKDEPEDLIKMTVKRATSADVYMDRTAGTALETMFEAAVEAGYKLYLKSGYRSYGTQKTTYNNRLANNNGKDDGVVAYPGASEHQTGLSCDILNEDYAGRPRMTTDFSETEEAQWMKENCADFGFILRYPDGATEITGIIFEPWHFRYVGKEAAAYIMAADITLEEFTTGWQAELERFLEKGGDLEACIAYEAYATKRAGPETVLLDVYGEDGDQEVSLVF